jgi:hypothetical protein
VKVSFVETGTRRNVFEGTGMNAFKLQWHELSTPWSVVDLGTGLDAVDGVLYVRQLILWNKSVMRKWRVLLPLKRFHVFGALRFVTDFTKICHLSQSEPFEFGPYVTS